jgi:hypothetical protein
VELTHKNNVTVPRSDHWWEQVVRFNEKLEPDLNNLDTLLNITTFIKTNPEQFHASWQSVQCTCPSAQEVYQNICFQLQIKLGLHIRKEAGELISVLV